MNGKKHTLKPISLYGHKVEDVLRAFMKVDPKKVEKRFKEEREKNKKRT